MVHCRQEIALRLGFDPLCHDLELEIVREADDRGAQDRAVVVCLEVHYE